MAERITVQQFDNCVEIRYRWFEPNVMNAVIIPTALLAFPVLVGPVAAKGNHGSGWYLFAVFVVFWAICLYCYLAKLLNKTLIKIDDAILSVFHSPIPWARGPTLRRSEVEGVFARERFHSQNENGAEVGSYTGEVIARVSGNEVMVVHRLSHVNYAEIIVDHIRKSLVIENTKGLPL